MGKPAPAEVQPVRTWLDNWQGVGHVVTGMNRQGFRLHLTNVDDSVWRATFSNCRRAGELRRRRGVRAVQSEGRTGPRQSLRRGIMSGQSLLVIIVVGVIAGWLAGKIVQGTGFGIVADLCIGIVGALIGAWLLPRLGIHLGTGLVAAIVSATVGAVVLLIILGLFRKRRRRWW